MDQGDGRYCRVSKPETAEVTNECFYSFLQSEKTTQKSWLEDLVEEKKTSIPTNGNKRPARIKSKPNDLAKFRVDISIQLCSPFDETTSD